mmetsp:Transcript_65200/g.153964  ORF Transcript_65200/g.153964 Transcript_65200/m.153964 type:complete len:237 (-) Transcript_65200:334-1044(-)
MGTSTPHTRSIGASRRSKPDDSTTEAEISEPTPNMGQPSSTVTSRLVLARDSRMVPMSSGLPTSLMDGTRERQRETRLAVCVCKSDRILRRLMTSALIPDAANASAASRATRTMREKATMVTSVPWRITLALPMGTVKSLDMTSSLTSNEVPYMISFSSKTTGLGSRMAALSNPLASSASYGERTVKPGQCPYHDAKHCECCAATPAAAPLGPRKTMGTLICPPLMYNAFAAELMT